MNEHEPGQIEPDLMTSFDIVLMLAITGLGAFVGGSFVTMTFIALGA